MNHHPPKRVRDERRDAGRRAVSVRTERWGSPTLTGLGTHTNGVSRSRRPFPALPAFLAAVFLLAAGCGAAGTPEGSSDPAAATATTDKPATVEDAPGDTTPPADDEASPERTAVTSAGDDREAEASPEGAVDAATTDKRDDEDVFEGPTEILPLEASFASECVRPGEEQTITIRTVRDVEIMYHATYSDGKRAHDPGYHGGNNLGTTDDDGEWEDTWRVAVTAPPGDVDVEVVAHAWEGIGYTQVQFAVADPTGGCV